MEGAFWKECIYVSTIPCERRLPTVLTATPRGRPQRRAVEGHCLIVPQRRPSSTLSETKWHAPEEGWLRSQHRVA